MISFQMASPNQCLSILQVFPASGWDVETQYHFVAFCKSEVYEQSQDDSDTIDSIKVSLDKATRLLENRDTSGLKTRCILHDALVYLKKL